MKKLQNMYDKESFFEDYQNMRETHVNANELLEIPVIKSMFPSVKGKSVIDLGCGDGSMTKYILSRGAREVLGIDLSKNMIEAAEKNNNSAKVSFKVMPLEGISRIKQKFDVAYSSLAFHYVEDFNKLAKDISKLLQPGGVLVFSQEHPVATAPIYVDDTKYIEKEGKRYYLFSDYNNVGAREVKWNNDVLIKYHRNFSTTLNALIKAGFEIAEVRESQPSAEAIRLVEKYKYQLDRPYFLFIKAVKK